MSIFIRLKVFSCHKPPMIFWLRNIFSVKVITAKKAAGNFYLPRHSETLFEAETSEFRCEINF